jgi:hypothetical protein
MGEWGKGETVIVKRIWQKDQGTKGPRDQDCNAEPAECLEKIFSRCDIFLSQSHELARDRTRPSVIRSRRQTS